MNAIIHRRHCEPPGPRAARPDDRLREAIHATARGKMDCFVAIAPRKDVEGAAFAGTGASCRENYLARLVELVQFFSDDQTPRERRKRSTGVDEPSASKRCNSTPFHWKPHF